MVDEREESYDAQEEGEYHFSDDQINYDLEPDTTKTASTAAVPTARTDFLAKFGGSRRVIIGIVAFFFLIFIVYKMLTSSSSTPPTDFSSTDATTPPASPMPAKAPQGPTSGTSAASSPPPAAPSAPLSQNVEPQPQAQQLAPPVSQPVPAPIPSASELGAPATQSSPAGSSVTTNAPQDIPPQVVVMQDQSSTAPPSSNEVNAAQTKMIMDRLAALEEQNAKLMSLLQSQVAQRVSESQMQNVAAQQKINTLSKRINNMENSINKIAQIMQDEGFSKAMPLAVGQSGLPAARASQPKTIYTVQAIIPGRAWLKSDAGDTVTVAEGDLLKDYGKITKIDPYDGIVEIDTGNKIITLTYGSSGD